MDENEFPETDFDCRDEPFDDDIYDDAFDEAEHEQNQDFLLAQQELEDFEQADEYFGGYGDNDW